MRGVRAQRGGLGRRGEDGHLQRGAGARRGVDAAALEQLVDSSWKRALDEMLLVDKKGYEKFSEQRGIIISKITKNTKAILVVHLYGNPC